MRRAILAVTGLAAGTTLLVVLKGTPATTPVAQTAPAERPGEPVVPAPAGLSPGATPTPTPLPTSAVPGRTPTTATSDRVPAPGRSSDPPTVPRTTASTPSAGPRTFYGPVVRTTPDRSFGNVQVQITVLDGRVTDVTTLEMPEDTPESVRRTDDVIRVYSGPQGAAVRAANSDADLDTVSGATSTSNAYERSLQAALDQAGLR